MLLANVSSTEPASALLVTELIIIAAVAIAVKWIRLPYTIALVTAGLGIGILRAQHFIDLQLVLTPELVFTIFLPVLLFEAAFNLSAHHLKESVKSVALFAVPGVLLASVCVGYALNFFLKVPLPSALVFGALISATDPISVLALFRRLRTPTRLSTIVEGESLFNDGAAVVIFQILLGLALTGEFSLPLGIIRFLGISMGGLLIGALLGYAISKLTATIDDHLIEITLSTILAYGSFILAEHVGASGVMAVIAGGLVLGNYGREIGMSARTQVMMAAFWEYAGFLMNSLVFLLIGTQVDLRLLATKWQLVLLGFFCVILARFIAIMLLAPLCRWLDRPISWSWRTVMVWAGLRGAISMALAIGLPAHLAWREEILLMTFGTVILSLYLQGLSMPALLRSLKIAPERPEELTRYEQMRAKLLMRQKGLEAVDSLVRNHSIGETAHEELAAPLRRSVEELQAELTLLAENEPTIVKEQIRDGRSVAAVAQVAALREAFERGLICAEVREDLLRELAEQHQREEEEEEEEEEAEAEAAVAESEEEA